MLPQANSDFRYDDLVENAIHVEGESDGSFDANDYVLFYGDSPHSWEYRPELGSFMHRKNLYSDSIFYFLSIGTTTGKRIQQVASNSSTNHTPSYTTKYSFHELDAFNPNKSGRAWLGESFDFTTSRTFSFSTPNLVSGEDLKITLRACARSASASSFTITEGTHTLGTLSISSTSLQYTDPYYEWQNGFYQIPAANITDGAVDVNLRYNKPAGTAIGYLDYIEIEYKEQLKINSTAWSFNAVDNIGPGQVFDYQLTNGNSSYTIWDISNPVEVREQNYALTGSVINFGVNADSIKHFITFNTGGLKKPATSKKIPNQNLHSLDPADFVIITHPSFRSYAEELAEFHRTHPKLSHSVHVVEIGEIFNEFSSGRLDPTALRDFIKMLYDRSGGSSDSLKYVLLFGDGSYDYRNIENVAGTNYIPTYQSRHSRAPTRTYCSDDYYGFLDADEGFWGENAIENALYPNILYPDDKMLEHNMLDVAIGRFPVKSTDEALVVVNKVKDYVAGADRFGSWRNRVLLVADHKDSDVITHIYQSNSYDSDIRSADPCYNIDKVFCDSYEYVPAAGGYRFPDAKEALQKGLNDGSLIVNYTGHGGESGWSNAGILEVPDITSLTNKDRYQAFITATCEFGRWDDPGRDAGGELLFLQENGGAIAMFTTVRVVFAHDNYTLNQHFYDYVFKYDSVLQRMPTMGEVFRNTKNAAWGSSVNNRNFTLLGDPALTLAYPEHRAVITKINNKDVDPAEVDTLHALTKVTVEGDIYDRRGNALTSYSGDMDITIYDKPSKFVTARAPYTFFWQKNKVFNGLASVSNGHFSFEFVVPIDVSYDDGTGKISLYFNNDTEDGVGCDINVYPGGTDSSSISDDLSPEVDVFMNHLKFADGQLVGKTPLMIAELYDDNGINTVGSGIGHELVAVLDDNESDVIILNDYYTAKKDSYKEGSIRYQFEELADGEHKLRVKVWDIANNSAESEITFIVSNDAKIALGHVLNYPNPFTTNTKFIIEHNSSGKLMDAVVKIYTTSGKMVKSFHETFFSEGNLYCDMEWDGLDEFGDPIGRGVYVYQVTLRDVETGETASKFEKLVLLR